MKCQGRWRLLPLLVCIYICLCIYVLILLDKSWTRTSSQRSTYICSIFECYRNSESDDDDASMVKSEGIRTSKQKPNRRKSKHKMALIIPFRDCQEELKQFAPHMLQYLTYKDIPHRLYVINQIDDFRFNRAALINVGFLEMHSDCDYLAMHDVDHLAINHDLDYGYPSEGPLHLPRLKYAGYVGGVLLMTNEHYRKVNGMSNDFWGWGKEDDDLYKRMKKAALQVRQPAYANSSSTYRLIHDEKKRSRDKAMYFNQENMKNVLDMKSGLNSVKYSIQSQNTSIVNGATVWFIIVRLQCNSRKTPFCHKQNNQLE